MIVGYNKKEVKEEMIMCTAATYKTKDFISEELWIMNFLMVIRLLLHRATTRFIFGMPVT